MNGKQYQVNTVKEIVDVKRCAFKVSKYSCRTVTLPNGWFALQIKLFWQNAKWASKYLGPLIFAVIVGTTHDVAIIPFPVFRCLREFPDAVISILRCGLPIYSSVFLSDFSYHCFPQHCVCNDRGSWDVVIPSAALRLHHGKCHAFQLHPGSSFSHGLCRKWSEDLDIISSQLVGIFFQVLLLGFNSSLTFETRVCCVIVIPYGPKSRKSCCCLGNPGKIAVFGCRNLRNGMRIPIYMACGAASKPYRLEFSFRFGTAFTHVSLHYSNFWLWCTENSSDSVYFISNPVEVILYMCEWVESQGGLICWQSFALYCICMFMLHMSLLGGHKYE